MAKKKLGVLEWIGSFLISIALINWLLVDWFNFNLVTWMTFGVGWLATIVYIIVAIFGFTGLIRLFRKTF